MLTPARTSLLKPAADQQVQPPNDRQGADHRQRCEYPEEHSASMHPPTLACCRVQQRIVTHGRRSCNNIVGILAKGKTPHCSEARCRTSAFIMPLAALF